MSGGRMKWKWDTDLPTDLVRTAMALKYINRQHPNVLWFRRSTGRLRAFCMGHAVGWSLAELTVLLQERDNLTYEEALSRLTPEVLSAIIVVRNLPPDPLSPEQARKILGMGQSWFREQVVRGNIPHTVVVGQRVFSQQAMLGLVNRKPVLTMALDQPLRAL